MIIMMIDTPRSHDGILLCLAQVSLDPSWLALCHIASTGPSSEPWERLLYQTGDRRFYPMSVRFGNRLNPITSTVGCPKLSTKVQSLVGVPAF